MPRRDEQFLWDIVEESDRLASFLRGVDRAGLQADVLLQRAVLQTLAIIGEAAAQVSAEVKAGHATPDWRGAADQRNIVAHYYWGIDWERIWTSATVSVPGLRASVLAILESDYPDVYAEYEEPRDG